MVLVHSQTDEQDVINFLLTTEIIPLCLRIMEAGSELSKTVATFILQKILLDETGLSYICQTFERFSHVSSVLVSLLLMSRHHYYFLSLLGQDGAAVGERAIYQAFEACCSVLFATFWQLEACNCTGQWPVCVVIVSPSPHVCRAREALRACIPDQLKDSTFAVTLKDDSTTKKWLSQLLQNLGLDSMIVSSTTTSGVAVLTVTSWYLSHDISVSSWYLFYKCISNFPH